MGQFEWESSNLHISYPFEQPGIPGLNDLFADALVIDTQQAQRVCLRGLQISDWTYEDLAGEFCYEDGSEFFVNDPAISVQNYGMWAIVTFQDAGKQVQLILNNQRGIPISVYGQYRFVTRAQECDPKAIKSIEVTDGVTSITHILTGDLELAAGYNISLQQPNNTYTSREGAVSVSLAAIPGAGLGVAPSDCVPEDVLRSFNTIGPDSFGHFVINAKECYRAIIPSAGSPTPGVFNPTPAMLQLYNDCSQCCTCAEYENCYKALTRLHNQGQNTGLRLARTIDDFNDLRNTINTQRAQRQIPTMDLMLRPAPGYIMGVQINLLNNWTKADILMNKDSMSTVLVKMFITSPDVAMSGAAIVPTSARATYLFNSRYGNPWKHTAKTDVLLDPVSFTSVDGIGVIVKATIEPGKLWHVIKATQFISIFFEIFWQDSVGPAEGDEITVRLVSSVFKPYNLTKVDTLIKPFDGTV